MLRQENAFFVEAPIFELAAFRAPARVDPTTCVVVEQIVDLFPGGLVPYWDGYREYGIGPGDIAGQGLLGIMVSLVGRLHRVIHYRCFPTLADAHDHDVALKADARWRSFVGCNQSIAAGSRTSLLRPSRLASRRSFFEPPN